MTIAVASGKGGTGKTTVAVNMALAAASKELDVAALDCDVENPNLNLFLPGSQAELHEVDIGIPVIDELRCTGCGECSSFCAFNALAVIKTEAMVFGELCHGCGGCMYVCPAGAIGETRRRVGVVEVSDSRFPCITGRTEIGQPMAPPAIRAVKQHEAAHDITIIDCPPGTACAMTTAIRGADILVLVTEPTPYGVHDLDLAAQAATAFGIPFGVVTNRDGSSSVDIAKECTNRGYEAIARLPEDRAIAQAYAEGYPIYTRLPEYRHVFDSILDWAIAKGSSA